jgi:hypothetical protein
VLAVKYAPPMARSPSRAANIIIIKDPTKNPRPLVLGFLDSDNNTIITVNVVGLIDATKAMGTIIDSKLINSDIYFILSL